MEDEELQIDPKKAREQKIAARKKLLADKKAELQANRNAVLEERKRKIEERKQALLNRKNPISIESKEPKSLEKDVQEIKKLTPRESLAKRKAEKEELLKQKQIKADSARMERKMQSKISSFKANRKLNKKEVQLMTDDQILALMEKEKKEKFEASAARTKELQERENRINDPDPNQKWTYVGGDENTANERYKIINTGKKWDGTGLPTDEETWNSNVKGVQDKYDTFEEYKIAAEEYRGNFSKSEKITQNRSDFTRKIPGSFDPDTFSWDKMARKWDRVPDADKDANNFKQYAPGVLRRKYDELGYGGLVKWLKANGGSYMLSVRRRNSGNSTEAREVSYKSKFRNTQ